MDDETKLTLEITRALHSAAVAAVLRHRGKLDEDELMICVMTAFAAETVRAAILCELDGDTFARKMRETFFMLQASHSAESAIAKARSHP